MAAVSGAGNEQQLRPHDERAYSLVIRLRGPGRGPPPTPGADGCPCGLLHNGLVLAPALDSVRLFLHVLAATIWVGGQLTLAALVPVLRVRDAGLPKIAARAFNRIAWPAFGVLVVTGVWNVAATNSDARGNYRLVLAAKVAVVAASGLTAYAHTKATTTKGLAVFGALTGLTALGALYLGILLAG